MCSSQSSIKKVLKCTDGQTWQIVDKHCTLTVCDLGNNSAEILIQQLNHPKKTFLQHSLLKSDIAAFAPSKTTLSCRWRVFRDRYITQPQEFWVHIYFDKKKQSEFQSFVNLIRFMNQSESPYVAPRPMQQTDSESTTSSQTLTDQMEILQQQYDDLAVRFKSMKKEYDKKKKELERMKWEFEVKSAGMIGLQENNQKLMERIAALRKELKQQNAKQSENRVRSL